MHAPAAAALLLAALTALPCRGLSDVPSIPSIPCQSTTLTNKALLVFSENYNLGLFKSRVNRYLLVCPVVDHIIAYIKRFRGQRTDAEASRLPNATLNSNTQPIITKLYQMLHTSRPNHQQNSNYTVQSFNYYDALEPNLNESTEIPKETDSLDRKRRVVNVSVTTPSQLVVERRRKPGETGSSAPLLNYIFDTYSNTHQHHRNDKVRPSSGIYAAGALEVEALVGSTAHLDCKVDALHDKLVSWVRRKSDEDPMELLYTGTQQYTADDRYSSKFIPPDIWRLEVKEVRASDASNYDCQMPTHPPRAARVTLRVPEVSVLIVDGAGAKVAEQVCELGSTVALRCEVRGLKMEGGPSLLWYRKNDLLNDDTTRGGISVRTEFGANGANSVLRVARVRSDDAGRYTCTVSRAPPPGPPPAHVVLHIIKGESLAELHQGGGSFLTTHPLAAMLSLCVLLHNVILFY